MRRRRFDAGTVRTTRRDVAALTWLAEQYAAPVPVLAGLLGCSASAARKPIARWRRAGWVEAGPVDADVWVWPCATTAAEYLGWRSDRFRPTLHRAAHLRAVAAVRLALCGPDLDGWVSERVLTHGTGRHGPGQPVPDAVFVADGVRALVEVELTPKSPDRLRERLAALPDAARRFDAVRVRYYASDPAARAIERAAAALEAEFPRGIGAQVRALLTVEPLP